MLSRTVEAQLGSPDDPLTREQHLAKQAACLAFVGLEANADALTAAIADFEHLDDAADVLSLLGARP